MIKDFIRYFTGDVIVKVLGLVSVPVYTYFLKPEDYGTYATIMAYVAISAIVLNLNTHTSIGRFYYEEDVDLKSFLSTTIILSITILIITITLLLLLVQFNIFENIFIFNFDKFGLYYIFFVIYNIFFSMYTQTLIPLRKSKEFTLLNIFNAYLTFIIVVGLLYFINATIMSFVTGVFIAQIVILIYIVYKLSNYFLLTFDINHVKYIMSYSVFLIPYSLSGILIAQIDRIMLGSISGIELVGIYSVAYVFGIIPAMLYGPVSNSWTPRYFKNMNSKNYIIIENDVKVILYFISFIILTISLFSHEIITLLINQEYYQAITVLPLLSSSSLFIILWNIWVKGIMYKKKTFWISVIGLISATVNIVLNYYLIPKFGLLGATYATLISYLVMSFLGYFISKYHLKVFTVSISSLKHILIINIIIFIIPFFENLTLIYIKGLYILFIVYVSIKYRNSFFKEIKNYIKSS